MNQRLAVRLWQALVAGGYLAGWEVLVLLGFFDRFFIPPPSAIIVASASIVSEGRYLGDFLITLLEFGSGLGVGVIAGLFTGLVLGSMRYWRSIASPYLLAGLTIPKIVLFPLFIKFFGLGVVAKLMFGAFHAFFPTSINTIAGIRNVRASMVTTAKSLGASNLQVYTKILLPASIFAVLASLRLAVILALTGVIIGEMLVSPGIGFRILELAYRFKVSELYALTLLISLFAAVLNLAVIYVERGARRRLRL